MPIAIIGMAFRGPGDATNIERFCEIISEGREAWNPVPKAKWNNEAFYHPDPSRNGTGGEIERLCVDLASAGVPLDQAVGSRTSVFVGSFCGDYTDILMRDPENVPMYQATSSGHSRAVIANRLSYFFDLRGPSATVDTACSSSLVALHMGCQSIRTGESRQALVAGANVILNHEMTISMSMMRFLSPDGRCYTFDDRANGYGRGEGVGCLLLKPLHDAVRDGDTIRAIIRNTGVNQDGRTAGITLPNRTAQEALIEEVYRQAGLDPLETSFVECHGTGTPAGDPLEAAAISKVFCQNRSPEQPLRIGSVKTNIGHLEGASGVAGVIKAVLMLENDVILPNRNFRQANPQIPLREWKLKVPTTTEKWENGAQNTLRISINSFGYGGTNAHAVLESARGYPQSRGLTRHYSNSVANPSPSSDGGSMARSHQDEIQTAGSKQNAPFNSGIRGSSPKPIAKGVANSFSVNGHDHDHGDVSKVHDTRSSARVFLLSAFDEASGDVQAKNLKRFLQDRLSSFDSGFLDDLTYTLVNRRTRLGWRAAVCANSAADLIEKLGEPSLQFRKSIVKPELGFAFTGQGAQWFAMGRELIATYPIFAKSLTKAGTCLKAIGSDWDLLGELSKDSLDSQTNLPQLSQPICTAIQLALVDLLASWNIRPVAVTGHSSGEIAAAYTAGALKFHDAIAIAYYRGIVSSHLSDSSAVSGAMLAVGIAKGAILPLLTSLQSGKVMVACTNSPSSVTVSGDAPAITELELLMKERGVLVKRLAINVAYHSHHMKLVADEYLRLIGHVKPILSPSGETVEFFSSVTGRRAHPVGLGPSYWVANLTSEVKFSDSLRRLCLETTGGKKKRRRGQSSSIQTLIEIGPHSALAGPIKQIVQSDPTLKASSIAYQSTLVRNRDAVHTTLGLAASLAVAGYPLDLAACNKLIHVGTYNVLVDLPPYSFNHATSYWTESRISQSYRNRRHPRCDILGAPDSSTSPQEPRWRNVLRTSELPWLKDHRIQGNVVWPAAGYLVMAIEAAHQRAVDKDVKIRSYILREVNIGQALVIGDDDGDVEIVTRLSPYLESVKQPSDTWDEFCVASVTQSGQWAEHCRGLISVEKEASVKEVIGEVHVQQKLTDANNASVEMEAQCKKEVNIKEFYEHLRDLGLDYGPTFASVQFAKSAPNKCVSTIAIPDTAATMPCAFEHPVRIHPATADSILHGLFAALQHENGPLANPILPVSVDELRVFADLKSITGHLLDVYTTTERKDRRVVKASMLVHDHGLADRRPRIIVSGLTCTTLAKDTRVHDIGEDSNLAYNIEWADDVDLLSPDDICRLCADIVPLPEEESVVRSREQAGFYLMEKSLQAISADEVCSFSDHHRKLWVCMIHFVSLVRNQQLGISTQHWVAANGAERDRHIEQVSACDAEGDLLCHVGKNMPAILRKEGEALSIMIEDGRLDAYYKENARFHRNYQAAASYLNLLGHKSPHLTILEIGGGTGGATLPILEALGGDIDGKPPRIVRFDFTDISSGFFDAAKEKLTLWNDLITYGKLDIEHDPLQQGYQSSAYDVIVAANVLHATKSLHHTLSNVRKLLKPGGRLILIELTRERITTSTIFGTLPGWWAGEYDGRHKGPTLEEEEWNSLLRRSGFSGLEAAVWDSPGEAEHQGSMMVSRAIETEYEPDIESRNVVLIDHEHATPLNHSLTHRLAESGFKVAPETLLTAEPRGTVCLVLCELTKPILSDMCSERFEAMKRIFTTAHGVLWITRGGQIGPESPDSSLVTGLSRTVRSEYGGSKIIILDVDSCQDSTSPAMTESVVRLFKSQFSREQPSRDYDSPVAEFEYILRNGRLSIPRLVLDSEFNKSIKLLTEPRRPEFQPFTQPGRPLVIEIESPGLLDSMRFVDDDRTSEPLPDDYVEIEVKATGFNFKDVMMAMGQVEVETPGLECSGLVVRTGPTVQGYTVGDRVACFAFGAFSNLIHSEATALQLLPDDMSFETAAALPVTYCTAYYSVYYVSRVQKGETVLVHAATGGLGQAIIELCRLVGAEIFATVGTIEKKKLLMERYQIPEDHIFSSRDPQFAQGVMRMTGGNGIDVIMNSVAGDMLRVTWECIAPFGRFVELGARDYTNNTRLEMRKFARNVTFTVVNLVSLVRERPKVAADVWANVMDLFRTKQLNGPFPLTVFGMSEIEKALRSMQSGKHLGKLVAGVQPSEMVKVLPSPPKMMPLKDNVSYLIVGGLSGIGQELAQWMADNGAKNLILTSRSGLAKTGACESVELLQSRGVKVAVYACDISDSLQVLSLLSQTSFMPPIRGVVQGAMVLQDTLLEHMNLADYEAVIQPKMKGTWNLHDQLPKDLDFFLMLSSTSGIVGNASQAAYAAASTFLDTFARYRRKLGLAATTLDLGVISDVGYVAKNQNLAKTLKRQGFQATSRHNLMALVQTALMKSHRPAPYSQIITGLGTWNDSSLGAFAAPMFSHFRRAALRSGLRRGGESAKSRIRDSLRDVKTLAEARDMICTAVTAKVSSLSMISVEDIHYNKPITDFGMDSLVAVELRNWLFKELDATMTILELLANVSFSSLLLKITKRSSLVKPSLTTENTLE
ncbi:MAG: hypothetical protein Q9160_008808 [Pyrenula sp. 1 TL-2023]